MSIVLSSNKLLDLLSIVTLGHILLFFLDEFLEFLSNLALTKFEITVTRR